MGSAYTLEDCIAKSNKIVMAERANEIRKMIAEGKARQVICDDMGLRHKVSSRTIETQYYKIVNETAESLSEHRPEIALSTLEKQNLIYIKCMNERKYKTALDATVAIAKLAKLYDSENITPKMPDITVTQEDFTKPLAVVGGEDEQK